MAWLARIHLKTACSQHQSLLWEMRFCKYLDIIWIVGFCGIHWKHYLVWTCMPCFIFSIGGFSQFYQTIYSVFKLWCINLQWFNLLLNLLIVCWMICCCHARLPICWHRRSFINLEQTISFFYVKKVNISEINFNFSIIIWGRKD